MAGNHINITAGLTNKASGPLRTLRSDLDNVSKSKGIGSIASGFGMGIGMAVFNLGITAIHDGIGAVEGMATGAMTLEASTAKLNQAFQNYGTTLEANQAIVTASVRAGVAYGFTQEDLVNSFALLETATGSATEAQRFQTAAMDLARLRSIPLAKATDAMTKVEAGQYRALKGIGIAVLPVTKAMDLLTATHKHATKVQIAAAKATDLAATKLAVLTAVEAVAGGQAKTFSDTTAGAFQKASASIGQASDEIGTAVLPVLADIANYAVDTLLPAVKDAFETIRTKVLPPLSAVFDTIRKDVLPKLTAAFGTLSDAIRAAFGWILSHQDEVKGALIVLAGIITAVVIPPFLTWAAATIAATWPLVAIGVAIAALLLVLDKLGVLNWLGKNVVPAFGAAFAWISKNILPPLTAAFNWIIKNILPPLGDALDWIGKNVLPAIGQAFNAFVDTIKADMAIVLTLIQPVIDLIETLQTDLDVLTSDKRLSKSGGVAGGLGVHNAGTIKAYDEGGVVPGVGPRLAIVHGGETVVKKGAGQGTTINVYNPAPEPATTSISREMRKLAVLGYVS